MAGIKNWCLPRKVMNNMSLLLTVFTPGLIFSKISMSIGLCLRIGFRIENTIKAMIVENAVSVINTSAIISIVISPAFIWLQVAKLNPKKRVQPLGAEKRSCDKHHLSQLYYEGNLLCYFNFDLRTTPFRSMRTTCFLSAFVKTSS